MIVTASRDGSIVYMSVQHSLESALRFLYMGRRLIDFPGDPKVVAYQEL